jgi:hypothetical protein
MNFSVRDSGVENKALNWQLTFKRARGLQKTTNELLGTREERKERLMNFSTRERSVEEYRINF